MLPFHSIISFIFLFPHLAGLEIYIENKNPTSGYQGNGTFTFPFNHLVGAFANQTYNDSSTIYYFLLMSDFFTINESDINYFKSSLVLYDTNRYGFFRSNVTSNIVILPLACYQNQQFNSSCTLKSKISIKSDRFLFWVSGRLTIANIILSGTDLPLIYSSSLDSGCYFSSECCSALAFEDNTTSMGSRCYIYGRIVKRSYISEIYYLFLIKMNNSLLEFQNFELSNFYAINGSKSWDILFRSAAKNVTILWNNSLFINLYFPFGMAKDSRISLFILSCQIRDYNRARIADYFTSMKRMVPIFHMTYSFIYVNSSIFFRSCPIFHLPESSNLTFQNSLLQDLFDTDINQAIFTFFIFAYINSNSIVFLENSTFRDFKLQNTSIVRSFFYMFNNSFLSFRQVSFLNATLSVHNITYAENLNKIIIQNLTIINVSSSTSYSSIFFIYTYNVLLIQDSLFSNIIFSGLGGTFYLFRGNTLRVNSIKISNIVSNNSARSSACICFYEIYANIQFSDSFFKNLTITNSYQYSGIAFFTSLGINDLSLYNCSFDSLFGKGLYGSLAWAPLSQHLSVIYCSFMNVTANYIYGGVFSLEMKVNFTLQKTFFSDCYGLQGVVIYSIRNSILFLEDVLVKNVLAVENGGGVFLFEETSIYIQRLIIQNATGPWAAGIYFKSGNKVSFFNQVFMKDMISTDGSAPAIFFENNITMIIQNLTVENSQALADLQPSGVIHFTLNGLFSFLDCFFNSSYSDHGGFASLDSGNIAFFSNCFFLNQSAFLNGGAFFLNTNNTLNFTQCFFYSGLSMNGMGAFFYITENNLLNFECDNFVLAQGLNGGGFYARQKNYVSFSNVIFDSNKAFNLASDVFLWNQNSFKFMNSSFINSTSLASAGSFYLSTLNYVKFLNVNFTRSAAKRTGGVFMMMAQNNLEISQILAKNIIVGEESGLIDAYENNNVWIEGLSFMNFSAMASGFLTAFDKNMFFLNNFYIENGVVISGAGVICLYFENNVILSNGSFRNVTTFDRGGVFQVNFQNEVQINFSFIVDIIARFQGAVCSLIYNNSFLISNTEIRNTSVEYLSGGVFWIKSLNFFSMKKVSIIKSSAQQSGGVFFLYFNNFVLISKAVISEASVDESGGGFLYAFSQNNISIDQSSISNVSAYADGGVFDLQSSNQLIMSENQIKNFGLLNDNGAMIYLRIQNIFTSINCEFQEVNFQKGVYGAFAFASEQNEMIFDNNFFESEASQIENSIFLVSLRQNNLTFVNFFLKIKNCFSIFDVDQESILNITEFNLSQTLQTKIAFQVYSSKLFLHNSRFLLRLHFNFLSASFSEIEMNKFSIVPIYNTSLNLTDIPQNFQSTVSVRALFILQSCDTKFTSTLIKLFKSNITGLEAKSGKITIIKTTIIGFKTNENSDAISLIEMNSISVRKSLFLLNRGTNKNGSVFNINFHQPSSAKIDFSLSLFYFNSAQNTGGAIFCSSDFINSSHSVRITRSGFQGNSAQKGGAIFFGNENIVIRRSNFLRNRAVSLTYSSKGGTIYLMASEYLFAKVLLDNNTFVNNSADIGGVAYHEGPIEIEMLPTTMQTTNYAKYYGALFASETKDIWFFSNISANFLGEGKKYLELYNIISGFTYDSCFGYIAGLDSYSQMTYNSNESLISYISIQNETGSNVNLNFTDQHSQLCISGPYTRNTLPIQGSETYQIRFKNDLISNLSFRINYRSCSIGERLADNFSCIECLREEYLFNFFSDDTSNYCLPCGASVQFYCFGGNRLTPKPGFWRRDSQTITFLKCRDEECLGDVRDFENDASIQYNENYAGGVCVAGYQGVLCNSCQDGFGKVGSDVCEYCSYFDYFGMITIFSTVKLLFSTFCIHFIFNMGLDLFSLEKVGQKRRRINVLISGVLKIWINHIEVFSGILVFPVAWPKIVKSFLKYLFLFSLKIGDTLPIECLKNSLKLETKVIYFKLIMAALYPFVLMFMNLFYLLIWAFFKRKRKNDKRFGEFYQKTKLPFVRILTMVFVAIIFLCYSDIIKICLEMVQYIDVGDERRHDYRLISEGDVSFDSSDYIFWLTRLDLPLLIFYGILFPSIILLSLLAKFRTNLLHEPLTLFQFSIIFYPFKKKYFFWEVIVFIRKLSLFFIQFYSFSSTSYGDLYPLIAIMSILLFSTGIQLYVRPYDSAADELNSIETGSLIALTATLYLGIYYSVPMVTGIPLPYYYHYLFGVIGGCINGLFFIKVIHILFKFVWQKNLDIKFIDTSKFKSVSSSECQASPFKLKTFFQETLVGNKSEREDNSKFVASQKNSVVSPPKENNDSLPQDFFPSPNFPPITVIHEQTSQEKINQISKLQQKVKKIFDLFRTDRLKRLFDSMKLETDYLKMIQKNKEIHEKIKSASEQILVQGQLNCLFQFYQDSDKEMSNQMNSNKNKFVFTQENQNFHNACLNNDQILIETKLFKIRTRYFLIGDTENLIFVKVLLNFISNKKIIEFELEIKKHEEMVITLNPELKSLHNGKEKQVELYLIALTPVTKPPEGIISCQLAKKIMINLTLKLPILLNRFILLEDIPDVTDFVEILEKGEILNVKIIRNVNPKIVSCFEDLCKLFANHASLGEGRIGGRLRMINIRGSLLNFEVFFDKKGEQLNMIFKFKEEKSQKMIRNRKFLVHFSEIVGQTLDKILGIEQNKQ